MYDWNWPHGWGMWLHNTTGVGKWLQNAFHHEMLSGIWLMYRHSIMHLMCFLCFKLVFLLKPVLGNVIAQCTSTILLLDWLYLCNLNNLLRLHNHNNLNITDVDHMVVIVHCMSEVGTWLHNTVIGTRRSILGGLTIPYYKSLSSCSL